LSLEVCRIVMKDCLNSAPVWATCHKRKYYSARNDRGNSGNPSVRGKWISWTKTYVL